MRASSRDLTFCARLHKYVFASRPLLPNCHHMVRVSWVPMDRAEGPIPCQNGPTFLIFGPSILRQRKRSSSLSQYDRSRAPALMSANCTDRTDCGTERIDRAALQIEMEVAHRRRLGARAPRRRCTARSPRDPRRTLRLPINHRHQPNPRRQMAQPSWGSDPCGRDSRSHHRINLTGHSLRRWHPSKAAKE
jgi:hypothetical protein